VIILQRQTVLLQVVTTLRSPRRFARSLHCRQEQRDQDANDRDYHQKFDQRKSNATQHIVSLTPHNNHTALDGTNKSVRFASGRSLAKRTCEHAVPYQRRFRSAATAIPISPHTPNNTEEGSGTIP
jgi:hypothetical protein